MKSMTKEESDKREAVWKKKHEEHLKKLAAHKKEILDE
jgi:hypothetical protein